jgi:nucleoside-diphosphate-sugar epimerase
MNLDLRTISERPILITGASGLMGSNFLSLFSKLADEKSGAEVHAVGRTGNLPQNISQLTNVKWHFGDLIDETFVKSLPKVQTVINCAGYGQPIKFSNSKIDTIKLNTNSIFTLYERIEPFGNFLNFSSSELYSGSVSVLCTEEDVGNTGTSHPRAAYIESKRMLETILLSHENENKIRMVALRLALAYGPGVKEDDDRVLNSFVRQALMTGSIKMKDSGSAMRTYCYVSDALEMSLAALLLGKDTVYNVGGVSRVSILELANLIGDLTNSKVFPGPHSPYLPDAPRDVRIDCSKALELIPNKQFVPLDEGLSELIASQRRNIK